jgi:Pyruvate/2-oxoacid:ferredoxin oxidoreductase delta subunit
MLGARPYRLKYGQAHKNARREMLAAFRPGSPCVRCGHPMWYPREKIHLDHSDDGKQYLGFSHGDPCSVCGERCNEASAGRKWAAMRKAAGGRPASPRKVSKGRKW